MRHRRLKGLNTLFVPNNCDLKATKTGRKRLPSKHKLKTFVQRRPHVFDAGKTLYTSYTNVLCLLGII